MKRILSTVLSILMIFSLCACKNSNKEGKYCSDCGESVLKDATFCGACGAVLGENNDDLKNKNSTNKTSSDSDSDNKVEDTSKPSSSTQKTSQPKEQTHTHTYSNYKCTGCGQMNKDEMFDCFKEWVINSGTLKGDYVYYTKTANTYGGYSNEDFSLYYWADTQKVEFCLHSVLDEDYSINFYIYIPTMYSGNYEYITSYYYRDTGESVCESRGNIEAKSFTKKQPLNSNKYIGSSSMQNDFMEMSREGICDAIDCLREFLQKEQIGYTLKDLGFESY